MEAVYNSEVKRPAIAKSEVSGDIQEDDLSVALPEPSKAENDGDDSSQLISHQTAEDWHSISYLNGIHKEEGGSKNDDPFNHVTLVSRAGGGDGPEGSGTATVPDANALALFNNMGTDATSEFGGVIPESIPDINIYQHKKTVAQGMMDLALFSANANQLRYVVESKDHPYFWPGVILIGISLIFQVTVGVGLLLNTRYNVKDKKEICIANKINNFTIVGIFLVTVINVFISAFGVASTAAPSQVVVATRFGNNTA